MTFFYILSQILETTNLVFNSIISDFFIKFRLTISYTVIVVNDFYLDFAVLFLIFQGLMSIQSTTRVTLAFI